MNDPNYTPPELLQAYMDASEWRNRYIPHLLGGTYAAHHDQAFIEAGPILCVLAQYQGRTTHFLEEVVRWLECNYAPGFAGAIQYYLSPAIPPEHDPNILQARNEAILEASPIAAIPSAAQAPVTAPIQAPESARASAPTPAPITLVEHTVVDHRARDPQPEQSASAQVQPVRPPVSTASAIENMRTPQQAAAEQLLRDKALALATYGVGIVRQPRDESAIPEDELAPKTSAPKHRAEVVISKKAAGKVKATEKEKVPAKKNRGKHQGNPNSDVDMNDANRPTKPSPRKEKKRKAIKSASVVNSADDQAPEDEPPRKKSRGRDAQGAPVEVGCDRCVKARTICTRVDGGNKVACDQCAEKKTGCSLADPSRAGPSTRPNPAISNLRASQATTSQWQVTMTNLVLNMSNQQDRLTAEILNNNRFVIALSEQMDDARRRMNIGVNAMRLWSQVRQCLNWSAPNVRAALDEALADGSIARVLREMADAGVLTDTAPETSGYTADVINGVRDGSVLTTDIADFYENMPRTLSERPPRTQLSVVDETIFQMVGGNSNAMDVDKDEQQEGDDDDAEGEEEDVQEAPAPKQRKGKAPANTRTTAGASTTPTPRAGSSSAPDTAGRMTRSKSDSSKSKTPAPGTDGAPNT